MTDDHYRDDPITRCAYKMDLVNAQVIAQRKGFVCTTSTDTYQDPLTKEYRQRRFLYIRRANESYTFLLNDWSPMIGIKPSRFTYARIELTPQFLEDGATILMIAKRCWPDEQ